MFRWFSGKYDSMKQRCVIDKYKTDAEVARQIIPDNELYMRYTVSLRLEMLFYGTVVVTDSQWYDGTYFSRLTDKQREFFQFKKLLCDQDFAQRSIAPLFEIKRRDNYIARIFGRKFEFSSLDGKPEDGNSFSSYVYHFGGAHTEDIKAHQDFRYYFNILKRSLPDRKFRHDFDGFQEHIRALDGMPTSTFSLWKPIDGIPQAFSNVVELKDRTRMPRRDVLQKYYLDKWELNASDDVKVYLRKDANTISALAKQVYPDRTGIKELVDHSKSLAKDAIFDQFMNGFNSVYNRGFALQHECELYDLADLSEALLTAEKNRHINIREEQLPLAILYCLRSLTWQDFGEFLQSPRIVESRNHWLQRYRESIKSNDENIDKLARDALNTYKDAIKTEFRLTSSAFRKGQAPKGLYNISNDKVLIGGSSDLSQVEDNEFSLFFDNEGQDAIVRCCLIGDFVVSDEHLGTIGAYGNELLDQALIGNDSVY